jgi:hypothetical protein
MLNGIFTLQSGFPISVTSGRDNAFTGIARDRADYIGGKASLDTSRPHGEQVAQFFNTAVFAPNAIGTFGNSGKNIIRGPHYINTDLGVIKRTRVMEHAAVEFRAEFFNIFNNVMFNAPNSNQSSAQFGRITSSLDPRIVQFGLKVEF